MAKIKKVPRAGTLIHSAEDLFLATANLKRVPQPQIPIPIPISVSRRSEKRNAQSCYTQNMSWTIGKAFHDQIEKLLGDFKASDQTKWTDQEIADYAKREVEIEDPLQARMVEPEENENLEKN